MGAPFFCYTFKNGLGFADEFGQIKPSMGANMVNISYYLDSSISFFFRAQTVINLKVRSQNICSLCSNIFSASSACFRSANFEQLGGDVAPNKWTFIWCSSRSCDRSASGHQTKRRKWHFGTCTCENITSMSPINMIVS